MYLNTYIFTRYVLNDLDWQWCRLWPPAPPDGVGGTIGCSLQLLKP